MAQYGLNVAAVSRLKGNTVAGALAYILRDRLYDEYSGKTHGYSHLDDFLCYEVLLPDDAPREFLDPIILGRAMENAERRYDARTGRILWLSLPNDLEPDDWRELVKDFVSEAFISLGMCAVVAIHDDKHPSDPARDNPNAHVLLTDRPVDRDGFCAKKNRSWNKRGNIRLWRRQWAEAQNRMFTEKGLSVRVTHESLEVQGSRREPTISLGRAAMALEDKGIATVRGGRNREIQERNRNLKRPRERGRSRGLER